MGKGTGEKGGKVKLQPLEEEEELNKVRILFRFYFLL